MNQNEIALPASSSQLPHASQLPLAQRFSAIPLAFCCFAIGSILIGFVNTGLITSVTALPVGSCIATSGVGLFIGSISELLKGETLTGTAMGIYSGFYFAYGILFIPSSGFLESTVQTGGLREVQKCAALFSFVYAVPAFMLFLGSLKQAWLVRFLMLQVTLAYFLSGLGNAMGNTPLVVAGGWFSITLGITAWYMAAAMLFTKENTYFVLPLF
ncbi:GPR1/FUN34/yaaH family-domain-containing protein [Halteromyces radiatus]|uniref:GPR1/FUN34/yaaH family-domain-containing protein n=1 Tax=Halteromyces radiatus TaxID=101107 RepID=UPI0022207E21|nr:GPR1/FUN34/yaaH family-domain-containing protein [Halteromyces radiatus]KAI8096461.1 GPR1/FUN34/yaaH family-domain-containing protein [Halteromyces radiatus]